MNSSVGVQLFSLDEAVMDDGEAFSISVIKGKLV